MPNAPPPSGGTCLNCGGCLALEHTQCRRCTCITRTPIDNSHPDWLAPGLVEDSSGRLSWGPMCGEPYDSRFSCTRARRHPGDHAVHVDQRRQLVRWSGHREVQRNCNNCGNVATACMEPACAGRGYCTECCACNRVPFREQTSAFIGSPSDRYPRHAAVEIECGKMLHAKAPGYKNLREVSERWGFRVGSDGSLTEFRTSTEVSTTPARGKKFEDQINDLGKALLADDLRANKSCGLHVHVNVRDYTAQHLLNFVYLYRMVEKPLYRIVAKSRRTNHFCREWGEHIKSSGCTDARYSVSERMKRLDIMCYGSEHHASEIRSSRTKHESRYHGLNFNSISVHGTIEFRMHHGTVNATKILMWAAVCSALVQYAYAHTEEECRALKGTNAEILEKIIGDRNVIAWTRARRLMFVNMERKNKGLPPRAKVERAAAAHRPAIPAMEPGEIELSEESPIRPRRAAW